MRNIIRRIVPERFINLYHYFWAFVSALRYNFPSRQLKVIGVTGTDGKSTVVEMIHSILEEAGFKTASFSSVRIKIHRQEERNIFKMTMPGRGVLQRFLRKAVEQGCQYAVIEVTSEGILQYRHCFIDFNIAVLTNLKPEHLERHKSFENYKKAKAELFQKTKDIHIINLDDENKDFFLQFPAQKKYGYFLKAGFSAENSGLPEETGLVRVKASEIQISDQGLKFKIDGLDFQLSLLGFFNIYNALAGVSVGLSQGISLEISKKALGRIKKIPGRMEIVISEPFKVIVDYAHTPHALKNVYQTIWKIKENEARIIAVFGSAGGGRDRWKRPEMGKIASRFADYLILTNEDPYDEDPKKIISEIKSGISGSQFPPANLFEILDRRQAIRKALTLARKGDFVVITGKGCEPWICLAGERKIPWDDREVVREEIKLLQGQKHQA